MAKPIVSYHLFLALRHLLSFLYASSSRALFKTASKPGEKRKHSMRSGGRQFLCFTDCKTHGQVRWAVWVFYFFRSVTNEELRSFLCEEGLVICLIHKTILDAYRDTLAGEKATGRFTDVARAKERAKQAAEAAARSEYEGEILRGTSQCLAKKMQLL